MARPSAGSLVYAHSHIITRPCFADFEFLDQPRSKVLRGPGWRRANSGPHDPSSNADQTLQFLLVPFTQSQAICVPELVRLDPIGYWSPRKYSAETVLRFPLCKTPAVVYVSGYRLGRQRKLRCLGGPGLSVCR